MWGQKNERGVEVPYLLPYQIEIADKLETQNVAVASANATGKTFLAAYLALWYLNRYKPSIVLTTAPTDRQVKKLLWAELRRAFNSSHYPLPGNLLSQTLKISDKHYAIGFTTPPRSGQKASGFHERNVLIIVDEANDVTDDIYDSLRGVMASGSSRVLFIGNPDVPAGSFFKIFEKNSEDFFKKSISVFDSKNLHQRGITIDDIRSGEWKRKDRQHSHLEGLVTPAWVAGVLEDYGENHPFTISRVFGEFPQNIEDGLCTIADIYACQKLKFEDVDTSDKTIYVSVDVARSKTGDDSVIGWQKGNYADYSWIGKTDDEMRVVGEVIRAIGELKERFTEKGAPPRIVVIVDVIGVGGGVTDRVDEITRDDFNIEVHGVNVGLPPIDCPEKYGGMPAERFKNIKAQLLWQVREKVRSRKFKLPECSQLPMQLSNIKWTTTSRGQTVIEPKDETKKRIGRSPDHADQLMLGFYRSAKDNFWSSMERALS
jgi:hypothetical protein